MLRAGTGRALTSCSDGKKDKKGMVTLRWEHQRTLSNRDRECAKSGGGDT